MVEAEVPSMTAYREMLESLAERVAKLVERYEESFVCRRFIRNDKDDRSIWVPTTGGVQRVDSRLIDRIHAEGDYMRIYSGCNSWLLHTTMRSLAGRLDHNEFVRVNRSAIVRLSFVDRVVHEGRHWFVQLHDGMRERVTKCQMRDLLTLLQTGSTT
jgi:two-component system LytT family response regulator